MSEINLNKNDFLKYTIFNLINKIYYKSKIERSKIVRVVFFLNVSLQKYWISEHNLEIKK